MFGKIGLVPALAAVLILSGCDRSGDGSMPHENMSAQGNDATPIASGEGAPTGGTCGTIAGIQCSAATDFCKTPVGQCGVQDAAGVCTTRPEICTREYLPVCGCDGRTYGNACEADAAGVNVESPGECPAGPGQPGNSS